MVIYLDVLWLLNFLFDLMLLMLTNYLIRGNSPLLRLVLSAVFAALIVPIHIYFPTSFFSSSFGKVIYSVGIILIGFRFLTIFHFLKVFLMFYFITFTLGGGLIALYFLIEPTFISQTSIRTPFGHPISWLFLLITFPIVSIFLKRTMDDYQLNKINYDGLCNVEVFFSERSFITTGFIDSGNQLVDPLTKYPVIICDEVFLKQWFTIKDWQLFRQAYEQIDLTVIPESWSNKIHMIPYRGVTGKQSFLLAIKPDWITITYNDENILVENVLIGIQFSAMTPDESYHCLLHPQIIALKERAV